jgi:hypothetical protein
MIEQQGHSALFRMQNGDRSAGLSHPAARSPAATKAISDEATRFDSMVTAAQSDASETASAPAARSGYVDDRTAGISAANATSATASADDSSGEHHGGFLEFIKTIIDIINPLQHIPVISSIYRHLTGDEISPAARIAGDALYGGPIGAAVAVANVAVESNTGRDIGENVFAMASGDKTAWHHKGEAQTQFADAAQKRDYADGQKVEIAWNDAAADTTNIAANDADAENTRLALLAFRHDLRQAANDTNGNSTEFSASPGPAPTKLSYRTGSSGNGPASSSEGRAQNLKQGPVPGGEPPHGTVNVKPALHSQKAPAGGGENRAVPPELIAQEHPPATDPRADMAQKMMDGLDQYAAMKRMQMQQGTFNAF